MTLTPFKITITDDRLAAIRAGVERFDWSGFPDAGGWRSASDWSSAPFGMDYWLTRYVWRQHEERIQPICRKFTIEIDGQFCCTLSMRAEMDRGGR